MTTKTHVIVNLDSTERTSGTYEQARWYLEHQITFSQKPQKSYWLRLQNTLLPKSFYSINSNYNVFRVIEADGGAGDLITITLTEGNYTISELIAELEAQLDANTANSNDYTITYDSITNKITISFTGASASITIDTIANGSTLNQVLGLGIADTESVVGNDNTTVITAGAGNATEAPFVVNLNTAPILIVYSSIASNNYYDHEDKQHIAVRVPITTDRNSIQYYENDSGPLVLISNKGPISHIDMEIRDPLGNIVDFNGAPWTTELCIYELTEPEKKYD